MSRRRPDDEDDQIQSGAPRRPQQPPRRDDDEDDDRPRRRPMRHDDDDYDQRGPAPRNGMALTAYYLGFLGLIAILGGIAFIIFHIRQNPFAPNVTLLNIVAFGVVYGMGGVSALMAIIFGAIGLAKAKQGKGTAHAVVGLVLGVLCILGLILILLMGIVSRR